MDNLPVPRPTSLFVAAMYGDPTAVEILIRYGSPALAWRTDDVTAARAAAPRRRHTFDNVAAQRLGGTRDDWNSFCFSPMRRAVESGQAHVVAALIRVGCPTLQYSGAAMMEEAIRRGHHEVAELLFAVGVEAAPFMERWPEQVLLLTTMPDERRLALRHRVYFSTTLLDLLLYNLDEQQPAPPAAVERKKVTRMGRLLTRLGRKKHD